MSEIPKEGLAKVTTNSPPDFLNDVDGMPDEIEILRLNEEHNIWKRTAPDSYDFLLSHTLEWPSLTVQWIPVREEPADKGYVVQNLILGTYTNGNGPNSLNIVQVELPLKSKEGQSKDDNDKIGKIGGFGSTDRRVQIIQQINHDGEVNRARYMPQNQSIIATKTSGVEVYVFDSTKHPSQPLSDGACSPDLRLTGHCDEGFGLSWSKFKEGHLLSSSDDAQICLWDINWIPKDKAIDAIRIFKVHEDSVEDVAWHLRHAYLFGSVGDDRQLLIWDLRTPLVSKPALSVIAHEGEVNCLAFNPFNEWIVATGSTDTTVKLFDLRKLSKEVHTLRNHKGEVFQLGWNPKKETVLASCCSARRLMVWDTNRIDMEQTREEEAKGPPELVFIHGGHVSKIPDFSWNPCEDWIVASVSEDNILHVWEMSENIYDVEKLDEVDLPM